LYSTFLRSCCLNTFAKEIQIIFVYGLGHISRERYQKLHEEDWFKSLI